MGETLRKRLRQERFQSPLHEAFLNLIVAANHVRDLGDAVMAGHGITASQYNVLRILRGASPEGHPRCEIAQRLLDRAPDVTRLIDRLEEKGLVVRDRSAQDRRHSLTRITAKGLRLLEKMEPEMAEAQRRFASRISVREARELSRICEQIYGDPG
ncbi:MAG: MarR family transcriptional regulator [Acidobacteriota bacterium]